MEIIDSPPTFDYSSFGGEKASFECANLRHLALVPTLKGLSLGHQEFTLRLEKSESKLSWLTSENSCDVSHFLVSKI